MIKSKQKLKGWNDKDRCLRNILIKLFNGWEGIDIKKMAYLLPRYEIVKNTGEVIHGKHGASLHVYEGKLKNGGGKEYFVVDTAETKPFHINGRHYQMPFHIDIEEKNGKEHFSEKDKIMIPWKKLLRKNQDVINHYGCTIEDVLNYQ